MTKYSEGRPIRGKSPFWRLCDLYSDLFLNASFVARTGSERIRPHAETVKRNANRLATMFAALDRREGERTRQEWKVARQ